MCCFLKEGIACRVRCFFTCWILLLEKFVGKSRSYISSCGTFRKAARKVIAHIHYYSGMHSAGVCLLRTVLVRITQRYLNILRCHHTRGSAAWSIMLDAAFLGISWTADLVAWVLLVHGKWEVRCISWNTFHMSLCGQGELSFRLLQASPTPAPGVWDSSAWLWLQLLSMEHCELRMAALPHSVSQCLSKINPK